MLLGGLSFLVSTYLGLDSDLKTFVVGTMILVSSLAILYGEKGVRFFTQDWQTNYMQKRTGITRIYNNLNDCEKDMKSDFIEAKKVSLLLQIGRNDFNSKRSIFWELAKDKNRPENKIRVLRASTQSPFLSNERSKSRPTSMFDEWQDSTQQVKASIELLRKFGCKIEDREHREPYLWRIWIFDNVAYVSGYLASQNNDRHAFVYRFEDAEDSLYKIFFKYFEYLWRKYDSTLSDDETDRWANWK